MWLTHILTRGAEKKYTNKCQDPHDQLIPIYNLFVAIETRQFLSDIFINSTTYISNYPIPIKSKSYKLIQRIEFSVFIT